MLLTHTAQANAPVSQEKGESKAAQQPTITYDEAELGQPSQMDAATQANQANPAAGFSLQAMTSDTPASVVINTRQAALDFYNAQYAPSSNFPSPAWTGTLNPCNAGTTSQAFRDEVQRRVNYFREMAGLNTIALDATLNANAQASALIQSANNFLNHFPPNTSTCYTAQGDTASQSSNLATTYGPPAIDLYIQDPGASNSAGGHRRWILYPWTTQMGTGDIPVEPKRNALWVFGANIANPRVARDGFVAWPPPGWVPHKVVYGRWSFACQNGNFSGATVSMSAGGLNIPVTVEPIANGFGENTLVWLPQISDFIVNDRTVWPRPAADTTYTVNVNNAICAGSTQNFSYLVNIFDPAPPAQTGTLVIDKTTVPADSKNFTFTLYSDNGSLVTELQFTLRNGQSRTLLNIPAGTYYVVETSEANYTKSFVCTDPSNDTGQITFNSIVSPLVRLAANENVTCSFTNLLDTTPPSVTINQAASQADPTSTSPINFTVVFAEAVTGFTNSDVLIGGTAGATTAVVTGGPATYTVTVSGMTASGTVTASIPAGVAVDASNNGNAVSTSTDNSVTFNLVTTGSIRLVKNTLNGNGTFNFTSGDAALDAVSIATASNTGQSSLLTKNTGTYTVSEDLQANWNLTNLACTDPNNNSSGNLATRTATITLDANETITCTFTNTFTPPVTTGSIVIKKMTVPAGGTGFTFAHSITTPTTFALDHNQSKTFSTVNPGLYLVVESNPSGYALTGLSCVDPDNGTSINVAERKAVIDVDIGETVTCTYTNTRQLPGTIVIVKNTNPPTLGNFTFTQTVNASGPFALGHGGVKSFDNVSPGAYQVTESATNGFTLSNLVCVDPDGGSSGNTTTRTATIDLDSGETITCTFTNTLTAPTTGTIRLVKNTLNGNGTFHFTSADADLDVVSITTVGNTGQSSTFGKNAGSYTVSEDAQANWTLTSISCIGDTDNGSLINQPTRTVTIDLDAGENITCIFTNTFTQSTGSGTVIIKKISVPAGGTGFKFTDSIVSSKHSFTLNDGASTTFGNVSPGLYPVIESSKSGYLLGNIVCSDPDNGTTVSPATRTAWIDVDAGETITCTFTNNQLPKPGKITIRQIISGTDGRTMVYSQTVSTSGSFALKNNKKKSFSSVPSNRSYPVSQPVADPLYPLTQIVCVDPDNGSTVNVTTRTAMIDLDSGESITCTFVNQRVSAITDIGITQEPSVPGEIVFVEPIVGTPPIYDPALDPAVIASLSDEAFEAVSAVEVVEAEQPTQDEEANAEEDGLQHLFLPTIAHQ